MKSEAEIKAFEDGQDDCIVIPLCHDRLLTEFLNLQRHISSQEFYNWQEKEIIAYLRGRRSTIEAEILSRGFTWILTRR